MEITYAYDKVGNRITKQTKKGGQTTSIIAKYNAANQLIQVGSQHYTYDANGNLTADGERTYQYNEFDQLVEIKNTSGVVIASYRYDEAGRRIFSSDSKGRTFYYYDGNSNHVLYEENSRLEVEKTYTYDDNGIPLTMTYKGINYYYLTNYRGDVLAMTDESGKVVASYKYDAWGNILTQSGEMASVNPYRYAGYRYDEDTKLYYLMARYYNPANGVFMALDPVRGDLTNPVTLNGYNYGNNNPVMNVDPDGTFPYPLFMLILRFAMPLVKKWGMQAASQIKAYANRILKKYKEKYEVLSTSNQPIKVLEKRGGKRVRIFSIDHHPVGALYYRNRPNKKNAVDRIWHYHFEDEKIHYIWNWSIPRSS